MVREWDPRTAPSVEIEAVLSSLNAALAADLPDDPPWRIDSFREYLAVTMPGERRICWIAEAEPGDAHRGEPRDRRYRPGQVDPGATGHREQYHDREGGYGESAAGAAYP